MIAGLIMGLAAPLVKGIANKFMNKGLNLAANAITGGGKKAKDYIEEKTGISLDVPENLTDADLDKVASLELGTESMLKLKELSLENLKEENRHTEASEQNWEDTINILTSADIKNASTRPTIAKGMAWIVAFVAILFSSALFIAIVKGDSETIKQLADGWPLMLAVLATPTALLRAYFGMRTKEKKARYNLASGTAPKNILTDVMSMIKK